jgi:flagellar basal body P-ring formation protein FlgA
MARHLLRTQGMTRHTSNIVRILTLPALLAASQAQAQALQTPDELRQAAEQFLSSRLNASATDAVAQVTAGAVDSRLRLARCAQKLQGVLAPTVREAPRMTVGIRCTQPAWTVYVPVAIETEMNVLVLRRAVARGSAVTAADVETQRRRVPGVAAGYLSNQTELERRHLKQPAGPGTALTAELLADDVLIRRGQRVTLVAVAGGFEVRAQGEAIADATAGGRVRVLNLSSHRVVEGQVESADRVRVSL